MTGEKLRRLLRHQWPHITLALRNAIAAFIALGVAVFLKLECPYWAAMTVLIVIQPTRDLLFGKSFYRLLGTAIGSVAGLLLLLYVRSPIALTIALSLWVAACVGIGNLLYGFRAYACMMAGCTCAIIAMLGYQNPHHLYELALGRIACIAIGIIVAAVVTALLTPSQPKDELVLRLRRVCGETVTWLALLLRQGRKSHLARLQQGILMDIAEIESLLDTAGAGSLCFRKRNRRVNSLIASLLSLLGVGRLAAESLARHNDVDNQHAYWRNRLARHLEEVARILASSQKVNCLNEMAATVAETKACLPLLGETLSEIVTSLHLVLTNSSTMANRFEEQPFDRLLKHRDFQEAFRSSIRAAMTIGAVGTGWALTGWRHGPMTLMAMSIMLSIFSNKEHPAFFVGQIFIGAAIGSMTAVICRIVLLPGGIDPFMASAIIAPFILMGVFAMTQRKTAIAATDATLFFMFVTQPGVAVTIVPTDLMLAALALVLGVGSAWIAYRYLVPINPAMRLRSLLNATARDIEVLATVTSRAAGGRLLARIQHRVIRMVSMATRHDPHHLRLVESGLAVLAIARSTQRLREILTQKNLPAVTAQTTWKTMGALTNMKRQPESVAQLLENAANTICMVFEPEHGEKNAADQAMIADTLRDAAGLFSARRTVLVKAENTPP